MDPITKLLRRYTQLKPPHESVRLDAQKAFKKVCGIDVPLKDIAYRGGTIYLSASPSQKSSVFTSKTKLLEELQTQTENRVRDIR